MTMVTRDCIDDSSVSNHSSDSITIQWVSGPPAMTDHHGIPRLRRSDSEAPAPAAIDHSVTVLGPSESTAR
eukprot:g1346.t1